MVNNVISSMSCLSIIQWTLSTHFVAALEALKSDPLPQTHRQCKASAGVCLKPKYTLDNEHIDRTFMSLMHSSVSVSLRLTFLKPSKVMNHMIHAFYDRYDSGYHSGYDYNSHITVV